MRCHSTAFLQRTCGKPVFSVHDGCQLAAADVFVCRFRNFFAFFLTLGAPILTPSVSWMCETSWLEWLNESSSTSCGETGSLCDRMNSIWSSLGKSFCVGWVCPAISTRISEKCFCILSPIVFSRASILPSKLSFISSMRCFRSVRRDRTSLTSGSSRTTKKIAHSEGDAPKLIPYLPKAGRRAHITPLNLKKIQDNKNKGEQIRMTRFRSKPPAKEIGPSSPPPKFRMGRTCLIHIYQHVLGARKGTR